MKEKTLVTYEAKGTHDKYGGPPDGQAAVLIHRSIESAKQEKYDKARQYNIDLLLYYASKGYCKDTKTVTWAIDNLAGQQ